MAQAVQFTVPFNYPTGNWAQTANVPAYSGAWCVELDFQLNAYDTTGAAVFLYIGHGLMLSFQQGPPARTYIFQYPSINTPISWGPTLGVPYHIAIYNNGAVRGVYVWNSTGSLVYSATTTPWGLVAPGGYQLTLGVNPLTAGTAFLGWIQDVRVWYAVPSPGVIASWMFRYVDSTHPNYASLRINYKTTEGTGTSLADSGSLGLTATLYGSPTLPTWVTGLPLQYVATGFAAIGYTPSGGSLTTLTLPVLSVKGMDDPDAYAFFPTVKNAAVDGGLGTQFKRFRRLITVDFGVVSDSASRRALLYWMRDNSRTLSYGTEVDIAVTLVRTGPYSVEWVEGFSGARRFIVELQESVGRTTFPV